MYDLISFTNVLANGRTGTTTTEPRCLYLPSHCAHPSGAPSDTWDATLSYFNNAVPRFHTEVRVGAACSYVPIFCHPLSDLILVKTHCQSVSVSLAFVLVREREL